MRLHPAWTRSIGESSLDPPDPDSGQCELCGASLDYDADEDGPFSLCPNHYCPERSCVVCGASLYHLWPDDAIASPEGIRCPPCRDENIWSWWEDLIL